MTNENLLSAIGQGENIAFLNTVKAAITAATSYGVTIDLGLTHKKIVIQDGMITFFENDAQVGGIALWNGWEPGDFVSDFNSMLTEHFETLSAAFAAITYSEP